MTRRSDSHRARMHPTADGLDADLRANVRRHTANDGRQILVRPLLATDREQLAARYEELSSDARRARFGSPPDQLSTSELDRLLDLDYDNRFALAALLVDDGDERGVGVARYARRSDDPSTAEVAVVVLDAFQQRGIGTMLLDDLAAIARDHGIGTFSATVRWENTALLDSIRAAGATVTPDEPGIAAVTYDLGEEQARDRE